MSTSGAPARSARLLRAVLDDPRHPLTPAAIRVERSSARTHRGQSRQTALTVWFTEGPALPGPASGLSVRTVAGVAGLVGVVALGALGVMAAQREPRLVGEEEPRRLLQPSMSADPPTDQG